MLVYCKGHECRLAESNKLKTTKTTIQRNLQYIERNVITDDIQQNMTYVDHGPGARPTKHISIEFEIRWKFRML